MEFEDTKNLFELIIDPNHVEISEVMNDPKKVTIYPKDIENKDILNQIYIINLIKWKDLINDFLFTGVKYFTVYQDQIEHRYQVTIPKDYLESYLYKKIKMEED